MAVSATDTPAIVVISQSGLSGDPGTNGTDGVGFNSIRKSLIDNPLCWLYKKNNIVNILNQTLTVLRALSGAYTDIYGQAQTADPDIPREEVDGWLIDGVETQSFNVLNNVPNLVNDFSIVMSLGTYSETSVDQQIIVLPALAGDLLSVGTDALGNWEINIQGSDLLQYQVTTLLSATSTSRQTAVITNVSGVISLYINDTLAGSVALPTGLLATMDLVDTSVTISGDFALHLQGLRFYDFVINSEERAYIN